MACRDRMVVLPRQWSLTPVVVAIAALGCAAPAADANGDKSLFPTACAALQPNQGPPPNLWSFIRIEGTRCLDGSSTGISVNPSNRSDKVLIFLEGGGACFNDLSCDWGVRRESFELEDCDQIAHGTDEYGRVTSSSGILDRTDPANPFRDYNFVFVPYCTADLHVGTLEPYVGGNNIDLFLRWIGAEFHAPSQVVVAGSSAGSLGAIFNYHRVADMFGETPVHLVADSGLPLPAPYFSADLQQTLDLEWSIAPTLPRGCADCEPGALDEFIRYLPAAYPDRRFAFVSSMHDLTMQLFLAAGDSAGLPGEYASGLGELAEGARGYDNAGFFFIGGGHHVYLDDPLEGSSAGGTELSHWLGELVDAGSSWPDSCQHTCDHQCVDIQENRLHCGGCNQACGRLEVCFEGGCTTSDLAP